MRTFKLLIAYDGTNYAGWQSQPDRPTIQAALDAALTKITGEAARTLASGRTDAGVHALGQVVSVRLETALEAAVLHRALNASLPRDIVVREVTTVPNEFGVIRDAVRKRYRYVIHNHRFASPFELSHVWHQPLPLDEKLMIAAAEQLLGEHDFASFETSGSQRETTVRTVYELVVRRGPAAFVMDPAHKALDHIYIEIAANGFLYNMVRNIVGTLVEVGRGAQPVSWIAEVLAARDRRCAGTTAPPHGLYMVDVQYPD